MALAASDGSTATTHDAERVQMSDSRADLSREVGRLELGWWCERDQRGARRTDALAIHDEFEHVPAVDVLEDLAASTGQNTLSSRDQTSQTQASICCQRTMYMY